MLIVLSSLLAGCGAPAQSQTTALRSQLDQANGDLQAAKADKAAADGKLSAAQSQVSQLQDQLGKLKQDNQLTGNTPAETARKIVKFYNETHIYSSYDLFVCGDMAQDIWNMLKTQNINARIQIGSTKAVVKDIQDSDHAWVLAEIGPGSYLALETTGGFTVTEKENPLYYQGWSFKNPKDFKDYITLLNEYILRTGIINDMVARYNQAGKDLAQANSVYSQMVATFNSQYAGKPVSADSQAAQDKITTQKLAVQEKQGRVNQALDEINRQKAQMPVILDKMKGLVG
jgi:hypothetical protein